MMKGSSSDGSTPANARRTGNPSPSRPLGAVVTDSTGREREWAGCGPDRLGRRQDVVDGDGGHGDLQGSDGLVLRRNMVEPSTIPYVPHGACNPAGPRVRQTRAVSGTGLSAEETFWRLHDGLPRQAPGSDASTRALLDLAGPPAPDGRAMDIGCGPGRSALVLATAGLTVVGVDTHRPFLAQMVRSAQAARPAGHLAGVCCSMAALPFPDASFDLLWAEGSAYVLGFDEALRRWRRLLRPGGLLVLTELDWTTSTPSAAARRFWAEEYPRMRETAANVAAASALGWTVRATRLLPDRDWWTEYYDLLDARIEALTAVPPDGRHPDPDVIDLERREIAVRREHGSDFGYTGYVLSPS